MKKLESKSTREDQLKELKAQFAAIEQQVAEFETLHNDLNSLREQLTQVRQ